MKKRSVNIAGHRTSISVEDEFWSAFKDIARSEGKSLNTLITEIDRKGAENLSSAIRLYVLQSLQTRLTESSRLTP